VDTKGAEIRTGLLKEGKEVLLEKGQKFSLIPDISVIGDNTRVGIDYKNLSKLIKPGSSVLIDDGLISLTVNNVSSTSIDCQVNNTAPLGQNKGLNLPNIEFVEPAITERDIKDIQYAIDQNLDFIAASFVRSADDVMTIRRILDKAKSGIKVISKIENRQGLENFDAILKVSDGIMVARGDLGVEIPIEQVTLAQKMMIRKCNAAGKFVITATQMLESMVKNPSPTRAEAGDVSNAVFDGTDCVMLSGETAKGLYPVESVKMMADICREAEISTNYRATFSISREAQQIKIPIAESIASSAVKAAFDLKASMVIVLTESGNTARLVAKYRPNVPILTVTSSERAARQCLISRALFPLLVGSMSGTASLTHRAILAAENIGFCKIGDIIVITSGTREGVSGATNDLKVIQVTY